MTNNNTEGAKGLKPIENLESFIKDAERPSPFPCPACRSKMNYSGRRTADPWPDEDYVTYNVELHQCTNRNCKKGSYEYWPAFSGFYKELVPAR